MNSLFWPVQRSTCVPGEAVYMLLIYLEPFQDGQKSLLDSWQRSVHYWPRSQTTCYQYDYSIVLDWWLLFSNPLYADIWLMKYSEHSRIVKTLFDE